MHNDPTLSSIRQIVITVSNVDAALGFYRDALGLTFLFRAGTNLAFFASQLFRKPINFSEINPWKSPSLTHTY